MRLAVRQLRILQTTKSFERCRSPVIDISDEMWILWLVGNVRAVLLEEGRGLFELLERLIGKALRLQVAAKVGMRTGGLHKVLRRCGEVVVKPVKQSHPFSPMGDHFLGSFTKPMGGLSQHEMRLRHFHAVARLGGKAFGKLFQEAQPQSKWRERLAKLAKNKTDCANAHGR